MREQTAVGDLNSQDQGTGARKNEGKDPLELVPIRIWSNTWHQSYDVPTKIEDLLIYLVNWQEQGPAGTQIKDMLALFAEEDIEEASRVFEFGAKKYSEWNWAKGMPWGVPTGCILRHIRAVLRGEDIDQDSGLAHIGHVVCNLIMLEW